MKQRIGPWSVVRGPWSVAGQESGLGRRHPRQRTTDNGQRTTNKTAFTLVELLVVMVIISILLGFILNAAMGSVKRAQERQTQTLITKLEGGLNDRLDALMQSRPNPNNAHFALAAVYNGAFFGQNIPNSGAMPGYLRAQTIAWYDFIKSEMPDVFFVQNTTGPYPINFAANSFPATSNTVANFILPMGNSISGAVPGANAQMGPYYGDNNLFNPAGSGVYGASYAAAAGIYKNLGYLPTGYDGVDNDGDTFIDNWAEGVCHGPNWGTPDPQVVATVQAHLLNHTHDTARSEMLYALLVEGRGPLGSVFNADEFTDKEVQDTDQDGLPEFVDAWGHPLQFFRWPIFYHSDIQRGQPVVQTNDPTAGTSVSWTVLPPYESPAIGQNSLLNMLQPREQDPLDLNQQLVAPMWWSGAANANGIAINIFSGNPHPVPGTSGAVHAFEFYFHRLGEPYPNAGKPNGAMFWDRGATFPYRRAFYSKFLIVSGGLDGQLGVFLYSDVAMKNLGANAAWPLIANENNAMPFSVDFADFTLRATYSNGTVIPYNPSLDPTTPSSSDLLQAAGDDISNQNIQQSVGIGGGG